MLRAALRPTAALFIAATALCAAKGTPDPRAMLEAAALAERDAHTVRAEGSETSELTGEGMNIHNEIAFKAALRDATHIRWETTGSNQTLTVCDGADHWVFSEPGTGFYRSPVEARPCPLQLPSLEGLMDKIVSVTDAGPGHLQFEGRSRDCEIVRAQFWIPAPSKAGLRAGTTIIRTLSIDPASGLILRDRTESWATGSFARFTRTVTFSSWRRDAEIPDEVFRFEVPTGTFLDPGPQLDAEDAAGVSRPQLIQPVEASWTEEAREAGTSGLVLVSFAVDAEGNPQNLAVTRGLGHGLDEKALEAVRQWRFHPGLKNGAPAAVANLTAAVRFHLP